MAENTMETEPHVVRLRDSNSGRAARRQPADDYCSDPIPLLIHFRSSIRLSRTSTRIAPGSMMGGPPETTHSASCSNSANPIP